MKGLILKDLMCLRKMRITFFFTVICTGIIGTMFVISARTGNIHTLNSMDADLSAIDIKTIGTLVLTLFMLLPLALAGDVGTVFSYDAKAGFAKVGVSLPISIEKRVLAKYITNLLMLGVGVLLDLGIAGLLASQTDIISFADFVGIILSVAALMLIFGAFTIFYTFCLGIDKGDNALFLSLFSMAVILVVLRFRKVLNFFKMLIAASGPEGETTGELDLSIVTDMVEFLKHKYYILLLIAVLFMAASYLGSVCQVKRKRGMI